MKTYVAVVDSYGFQKRYWTAGDKVELPDDHKCPEYFKPAETVPAPPPIPDEPNTFSGINEARKESAPKTGMAHQPEPESKKAPKTKKK